MATIIFYKDLPLDFTPHPVSGDVLPVTNEVAIRRAVINLIRTKKGTRPFFPEYGCDVDAMIFGNDDAFTKERIKDSIVNAISRYEPRINLEKIAIRYENYGLDVTLTYRIKNVGLQSTATTTIKRAA